ncbi:hypothetical protein BT63DRAFT_145001 [Microthyrium microscopicum]|uniref:Uncharacterized protein n=1 Tax=Microthyrium microscopicum TaxID=703497 RepID=A0A6A6UL64_9PEZI|nr:hypothetical protein BT63DRAFT_145001 [Microthyrium microscopicum]
MAPRVMTKELLAIMEEIFWYDFDPPYKFKIIDVIRHVRFGSHRGYYEWKDGANSTLGKMWFENMTESVLIEVVEAMKLFNQRPQLRTAFSAYLRGEGTPFEGRRARPSNVEATDELLALAMPPPVRESCYTKFDATVYGPDSYMNSYMDSMIERAEKGRQAQGRAAKAQAASLAANNRMKKLETRCAQLVGLLLEADVEVSLALKSTSNIRAVSVTAQKATVQKRNKKLESRCDQLVKLLEENEIDIDDELKTTSSIA